MKAYKFVVTVAESWRDREKIYEVWAFNDKWARASILRLLKKSPLYCTVSDGTVSSNNATLMKPKLVHVGETPRSVLMPKRRHK